MINPADIRLDSLPWVPLDATAGFPAQPGIYFAIDANGVVQYIGRTKNVRGRWKNHHRFDDLSAIGGIKIAYLFIDLVEMLPEIEKALILWFDPQLNVANKLLKIERQRLEQESKVPKRGKATIRAYGEKKSVAVNTLFTKTAVEIMDRRAKSLNISRGEFLERVVRWVEANWNEEMEQDLGWEDNGYE